MFHVTDLMAYDMERQFARSWSRAFDEFERQSLQPYRRYRDPFEELDSEFSRRFQEIEMESQNPPKIDKDANVYYKMIMKTDNNGEVKVKTMEKEPGSEWKVTTEEYKRGDKAIEDSRSEAQQKIEAPSQQEKPKAISESS